MIEASFYATCRASILLEFRKGISLQATACLSFHIGLQIRPRRFDSGFGLHIRKPRRPRSTGFFYGCDLADHFRNRTPSYLNCSMALFADRRLLKQPELLEQTMWAARGMVLVVERPQHLGRPRDVITITRRINGGLNGLEERDELWERARAVLCLSSALSQG